MRRCRLCCRGEWESPGGVAKTRPRLATSRLPGRDAAAAAVLNLTCCSVIRTSAEDTSADGAADCVSGIRFSVASPVTGGAGGEFRISLVSIAVVSLSLLAERRHLLVLTCCAPGDHVA